MNAEQTACAACIRTSAETGVLRKLVFSSPASSGDLLKVSGKLCLHRGERVLVLEWAYTGGRVSQKLCNGTQIESECAPLFDAFRQVNLLTGAGDAELRTSRKGHSVFLGGEALARRMAGSDTPFLTYDAPIDRQKQYILSGDEPFLAALGISDENGRVHDKRQAKFRQINRFLEYLDGVYPDLPSSGPLLVYDLCCGKSYLSFAVYHFLTAVKGRAVRMIGVDLKKDVMDDCAAIAASLGFLGMEFRAGDVKRVTPTDPPDLVISLHACDIATDLVLDRAVTLGARVILSTPCCHRHLSRHLDAPALAFVTNEAQLRGKLAEALTDGLRLLYLRAHGYRADAAELTDPENTPKNTLLRAVRRPDFRPDSDEARAAQDAYREALSFLLGENTARYLEAL